MKYVSWFFGIIGIVVAVIFGSILIRNTLRGNVAKDNAATLAGAVEKIKLSDYKKSGVTVRMSIEGPVVADENYRKLEVDITNSSRDTKVITGYRGTVLKESKLDNNEPAFDAFMDALDNAGFTAARPNVKNKDYTGQCATGRRYIFDLIEDGKTISSLWRSTCTDLAPGTLGVMATPISNLFRLQLPNVDQVIGGQNVSF
jgi:hypothetical protein